MTCTSFVRGLHPTFRIHCPSFPLHRLPSLALSPHAAGFGSNSDEEVEDIMDFLRPRTVPATILSTQDAVDALITRSQVVQASGTCHAFYSSDLGGIVTDPSFMVAPFDDSMIHTGHAVLDTITILEGFTYRLDDHLDRLLSSATRASIPLPVGIGPEQMRRTILETAAVSCKTNAHIRVILSAGRRPVGRLSSCGKKTASSSLYVLVYTEDEETTGPPDQYLKGYSVKTSPVPIKAAFFSRLKSTNYLPNVLCQLDAEEEGFDFGIFIDENGFVAQGPSMNIGLVTREGVVITPPFDNAMHGLTIRRLMELLPDAIDKGLTGVTGIEQRHFTVEEAKEAAEVFLSSRSLLVVPVVKWDGTLVFVGKPGPVTLQLRRLMQLDMRPPTPEALLDIPEGDGLHDEIPYGFMTGMGIDDEEEEDSRN